MAGVSYVSFVLLNLCSVLVLRGSDAAPTPEITKDIAIGFMAKYGYVDTGGEDAQSLLSPDRFSEEKLAEALRAVQKFGGIPQTGILDQETLQLMSTKRCGLPDVVKGTSEYQETDEGDKQTTETSFKEVRHFEPHDLDEHHYHHHHHHHNRPHHGYFHYFTNDPIDISLRRKKRFILASRGWDKRNLKYYLANWAHRLNRGDVLYTFQSALDAWAKHGGLRFSETSDPKDADITFGFYRGQHGDQYPFDGRGNVLAHAFFPGAGSSFEGDVHFDDDENWKINMSPWEAGTDLYTVTLHELGHSLGLSHSPQTGSIMNPYYRGTSKELGYDDILAMHNLYARRRLGDDSPLDSRPRTTHFPPLTPSTRAPPPAKTPTSRRPEVIPTTTTVSTPRLEGEGSWGGPRPSDGCFGHFDTVAYIRNELFIIKDQLLWRLIAPGKIQSKYPVDFHQFFYKLPASVKRIDAIYQRDHDSKIIMFTGKEFWVFDGNNFVENSPRSIMDFGLPRYVEKVDAATSRNGTVYLFVGDEYWSYDEGKRERESGSPRPIQDWGIPSSIDAALTYSGITYFFKGDSFWEYDEKDKRLKYSSSRKRASDYWLNC